jgi:hypothetical protein
MSKKSKATNDSIKLIGMFKLQIQDDTGKIVGDSGWRKNLITNSGRTNILNLVGTTLTGSQIAYGNVGTGGAPVGSDNVLAGEVQVAGANSVKRQVLTAAASSDSSKLRFTFTMASANSFETASNNISNVGLFSTSGPVSTSGSLMAGNTFTSSALATNQNVNVTYDLIFT